MSCNNCRNSADTSCTDIVPSGCVSWQGDKVDDLDICVGDSLTYVGNIVLAKIKDILKGKGIILEDLTLDDCEYLADILGNQEKSLINLLETYKQAICQLNTKVEQNGLDFIDISKYTLGCIASNDPCSNPLTFKTLIQAIITKVCSHSTQFTTIAASLLQIVEEATGDFLVGGAVDSAGGNGINQTGSGATAKVIIEALVPPNCPILYTGSLSVFDGSGIGLPNTAYQGWLLCNGANGTPNSTSLPQNLAGTLKYIIRLT